MELGDHIKIYDFPTGRRIFAHTQIRELAVELALKAVIKHVDIAIAHDRETLQMDLRRRARPQSRFTPEAGRHDVLVDRALSGLDSFLHALIRLYGEDVDPGRAAAQVRNTIFPDGVGAITSLPYIQEDQAVAAVLERLRQDDMAPLLARIPGVDAIIEQVRVRHRAYHEVLRKENEGPTTDEVRGMQEEGQEYLRGTVALILAHYVESGDREAARRLIEPIERQSQDIADARRRRRAPMDVNPDTGEEVEDDTAEPAPAAE